MTVIRELGGRKFLAFLVLISGVYLQAAGIPVDVDALGAAAAIYIGAEGAADLVSRFKSRDDEGDRQ